MRISLKWLSELVARQGAPGVERGFAAGRISATCLRPRRSRAGSPRSGSRSRRWSGSGTGLEGVVVARILASDKHPNAEKLSVTRVDAGQGEPLQVVCGAKNYQVGDVVPLATVGASLPGGTKIEKAKLRGVESFGMLCSARELGLSEDASGLLVLPADVVPGTPHRPGAGARGRAPRGERHPQPARRPLPPGHRPRAGRPAGRAGAPARRPPRRGRARPPPRRSRIRIDAPEKCARYTARVIEGVKIGPSPAWLARRLESCGVRSISNVVDATNLVLLELGHPLHAFDLEKVAGRQIVVRTARPGERLTTLDGKDRVLEPDDLLIADQDAGQRPGRR